MRRARQEILEPGVATHKIWRCHNREHLLASHQEKHAYLTTLCADYTARCSRDEFQVHTYAAMDNHYHEESTITGSVTAFSEHMRRAHGRFGQAFNRRHDRLGKVACDRPRTLRIQDDVTQMRVAFYILANPLKARQVKDPRDIRWKDLFPYRFYAYGERNRYSDMLTHPNWYLELGKTPRQRQRRFRALFDRYLVDAGLRRDPKMTTGHFIGAGAWIIAMTQRLGTRSRDTASRGVDPADTS